MFCGSGGRYPLTLSERFRLCGARGGARSAPASLRTAASAAAAPTPTTTTTSSSTSTSTAAAAAGALVAVLAYVHLRKHITISDHLQKLPPNTYPIYKLMSYYVLNYFLFLFNFFIRIIYICTGHLKNGVKNGVASVHL